MAGNSQNAIIGDSFMDEPQTRVDPDLLTQEQSLAKYSGSKEYKALKQHLEERIEYYKQYLPDGRHVTQASPKEVGDNWIVAVTIITELQAIISTYENAKQSVNENAARP